jgi:glutamate/tyrosine decarboxylase-like PLP-dependent enzyme
MSNGYRVELDALQRAADTFADAVEMVDEVERPHRQLAAATSAVNAALGVCAAGGVHACGTAFMAMLDRAGREMLSDVHRVRATIAFYERAEVDSTIDVNNVARGLR